MALQAPFEPQKVSDVDVAFPARALEIMPVVDDIPAQYWDSNPWSGLFWDWMTGRIDPAVEFHMNGVDGETAYRHLSVIMGSFAPKHEHKEAAFAFLCGLWFTQVVNGPNVYEEI